MLDSGYESFIENLIENMSKDEGSKDTQKDQNSFKNEIKRQVVLCSATVTNQMEKLVSAHWTDSNQFSRLIEKQTHMNLSNLDHEFIKLGEKDKYGPLELILKEFKQFSKETGTSSMVFCNSIKSARSAEHTISKFGYKVSSLHGDIPPKLRQQYFDDFKNRRTEILISTDLGSRGLDFPFVSHIYNLDFPRTVSDYMHRAGRAGRAGRIGYVKSFYRNYDNPIIEEMRKSHEESTPMNIGNSAFNLRKDNERPVAGQKVSVSNPDKRRSLGDPLSKPSNLILRTYNQKSQKSKDDYKKPERVLQFKQKSKSADLRSKTSPLKEKIGKLAI